MVGLSLFLLAAVGVVVWLTHHDSTYHAPLDRHPPPKADVPAATRLLLGNERRWQDIYDLNPHLRPDQVLPAGTELRVPADARDPG